jgi:hypothetical protein
MNLSSLLFIFNVTGPITGLAFYCAITLAVIAGLTLELAISSAAGASYLAGTATASTSVCHCQILLSFKLAC